jgi:hypothetical protein
LIATVAVEKNKTKQIEWKKKKEADGDGFFITVHLLVVQKHSPSMGIGSADRERRRLNRF